MALIRCPQCDTGHELDDALFAGGKRRVRCANCRTVWLADAPKADSTPETEIDEAAWGLAAEQQSPAPMAQAQAPNAPQSQDDIDSLFDAPLKGAPAAQPQSQDDIDSLFDEPAAKAPPEAPKGQDDIDALMAASAAATAAAEPVRVQPKVRAEADDTLEAAAERRSERRRKAAEPPKAPPPPPQGRPVRAASVAVMFLAASVGTLATLLIFRHDVARLAPVTEKVYSAIGLGTKDVGLFFEDVRSRISREEGRETLEVVGTIHNKTNKRQMLPMLRLSIRSEQGQELYVWTATADQADIGPMDKAKFRRRLASPPPESHSVEVRFVPDQDVVASIR